MPFLTKVIAANASEAAHVLDGLMHHETALDIREHYRDTAGAIDQLFALRGMLGYRFAPRIRGLAERRLYIIDPRADYKALRAMIGGVIDMHRPCNNWDEILRSGASINRPDRGKFIWPSATAGAVAISAAQMAYMLEEIDWRNPQLTYRPQSERYEGFIEALWRRLNQGRTLLDEIPKDMLGGERADENATDSRE